MTLNITVLTRESIYQSADFRLTNSATGAVITDRSGKTVSFMYPTWTGFVTYTGLGSWSGRAVSEHVADRMGDGVNRTMSEVADRLAQEGTRLLAEVRRRTGRQMPHTFTLAGFEAGSVRVFVVSDFEDCFGHVQTTPAARLTITSRALRPGSKATVVVTGCKQAVPVSDRRVLGNLAARYPGDGGRIRRRMQALNAAAARSTAGAGLVSEDCVVLSFRSDSSGVLHLSSEATAAPSQFQQITYGMNQAQMLEDAFKNLGIDPTKVRLVQGATASTHAPGPRARPSRPCTFALKVADPSAGYVLSEVTSPEFEPMAARDINDHGHVVGTGRLKHGRPQDVPWRLDSSGIARLGYDGTAQATNIHGQVAGTIGEQGEQAIRYASGVLTSLPLYHGQGGEFEGTGSVARAINQEGVIAGTVRSRAEEQGRPNTRASAWKPDEPPQVLTEVQAEFGCDAVDVNESGRILVMAGVAVFDIRSILWTLADNTWIHVGDNTSNVFPIALTDEGSVLGQARNNRADPIAVVCRSGGVWERLGTDDAWVPIDMNNAGDVVGWAWVDGLQRPWLRRITGQIIWLPYVIEHHTIPTAINSSGQVVGSATADHGSHAVIWEHAA